MPTLTPFQQAALNYKNHISLTANAGSGKTFVLANRYVEIAINENIPLSKIVAITFTEKAAGELNKKIADEIGNRINEESDSNKLKILHRLRRQLTSANISTIHSFCINLLKEFSPEAGIDANFVPLNQQDADELFDLTIEEFIAHNLSNNELSKPIKDTIRLLGGKNNFVTELKAMTRRRKILSKLQENLYSKSDDEILKYYSTKTNEFLSLIFTEEIAPLLKLIKQLNDLVIENDNENQIAIEIQHLSSTISQSVSVLQNLKTFSSILNELLTKQGTVKKRGYIKPKFEIDPNLINNIESRINDLKAIISFNYDEEEIKELIRFSKQIFQITNQLLLAYDERKRKNGYLDFEDILIETKELTAKENFNELLKDKYEYIMIDEYQDTNEIQYEIFMPILNNLKKGNLFVVGDEKQSIYMFREAELEVFHKTKTDITKINTSGDLLLPHSFRVAPQIAHFTNELFSNLFKNANPLYNEVEYNNLICARAKEEKGIIEFLINTEKEQDESLFIADKIVNLIKEQENLEWNDFAVLCRKRNAFLELEKTFGEYGIPYVIAGGKGFYQRQTIYDVFNYISFLLNPNDDASLVGLLRSPFYSIADDIIYKISLEDEGSYFEKLKLFTNNNTIYQNTVSLLEKHLSLASSIRLPALLREIFNSCDYWAVTAAKQNFEQEISNLFKLLGVARKFSLQSFKTLYDFKLFLGEAISLFEDEGQAQLADAGNAVKIMTLHQAKGLEFKNVFLFKCNEKVKDDSVRAKSLAVDKTWGLLTKVPVNKNYFADYVSPAVVDIYNFIENRKQVAEAKRLFYVGVTRAIDNLYITGTVIENKIEKNSFINFASKGLNLDFQNEELTINSSLKFMADSSHDFKITDHQFETKIKINTQLQGLENSSFEKQKVNFFDEIKIEKLTDHEKNEIVSATKIAIFKQCPTKYYLTYELGYTELFKLTKTFINEYDFKYKEDDDLSIYADIRGQIIHKILEEETDARQFEKKVKEEVDKFTNRIAENKDELTLAIINDVKTYMRSETYKRISRYKAFQNEYEVYSKEDDYYVYGIIDKLIFDDNRLFIIDYKTDRVKESDIKRKAEHYVPQLKFYAYVLSRKFRDVGKIEVELIFIKHPDKSVKFAFDKNEILSFGEEIKEIVELIRKGSFEKNLNHCSQCHFTLNKKCVLQS